MNEFLNIFGDVLRLATFQERLSGLPRREFGVYWPERLPHPDGRTRQDRATPPPR